MIGQNSVMSLFSIVSDSNTTASENVKARNSGNNSSQFAQILDMFRSQNNNRTSVMKRPGDAVNNDSYKKFGTVRHDAGQKERIIRNDKEVNKKDKEIFRNEKEIIRGNNEVSSHDRCEGTGNEYGKSEMKVSDKGSKSAEVGSMGDTGKDKDVRAEKNVEKLALILGLDSDELMMILNASGINVNDLCTGANVSLIAEKLADFLGLDNQLKKELQQIIADITEHNLGGYMELPGMSVEDVKKGLNIVGSIDVVKIKENNVKKLADAFRQKLAEVSLSSEEGLKEVETGLREEGLTAKAEDALSDYAAKRLQKDVAMDSANNNTNDEIITKGEENTETFIDTEAENVESIAVNSFSNTNKQFSEKSESGGNETAMNLQTNAVFLNSNVEKTVNETFKPVIDNTKSANEVVRQVVEKASVIINGDKSEMILSLEPESLGRISLKVVTENGIVIAKFVTENDQVKQILESNMHLLKENLESQGLNVQGFSVSVRQDSGNEAGYFANGNDSGQHLNVKPKNISIAVANPTEFIQTRDNEIYLYWDTSTINLTA